MQHRSYFVGILDINYQFMTVLKNKAAWNIMMTINLVHLNSMRTALSIRHNVTSDYITYLLIYIMFDNIHEC